MSHRDIIEIISTVVWILLLILLPIRIYSVYYGKIASRKARKFHNWLIKEYALDCIIYGEFLFKNTDSRIRNAYLGVNQEGLYFIPADISEGIIKIRYENIEYYEKNVIPFHEGQLNTALDGISTKFTYRDDNRIYTVHFDKTFSGVGFNKYALKHGNLYTYIDQYIKRKTYDITI